MPEGYITRQECKARRDLKESDTILDGFIDDLILAASRKVDQHCNVVPGAFLTQTQTRLYTATDSYCLKVDNLLSITAATGLLTDDGWNRSYSATWNSSQYDLWPYNASMDGIPYREIRVRSTSTNTFPVDKTEPRVRITGAFGYAAEAPAQIKEACYRLIDRFLALRGNAFGVVGSGELGTFRVSPMDPEVAELLAPFRERGMA